MLPMYIYGNAKNVKTLSASLLFAWNGYLNSWDYEVVGEVVNYLLSVIDQHTPHLLATAFWTILLHSPLDGWPTPCKGQQITSDKGSSNEWPTQCTALQRGWFFEVYAGNIPFRESSTGLPVLGRWQRMWCCKVKQKAKRKHKFSKILSRRYRKGKKKPLPCESISPKRLEVD